jgi:hypothetical protein
MHSALDFVTQFCCDRHNDGFELCSFFPGEVFTGLELGEKKATRRREKKRIVKHRAALENLLRTWRSEAHQNDPLRTLRSVTWIIDDDKIKTLAALLPSKLQNPLDITQALEETEEWSNEWAQAIFNVICSFVPPRDASIPKKRKGVFEPSPSRITIRIPALPLRDRLNIDFDPSIHRQRNK